MSWTAVSDWPTPTVSTMMLRYPAASHSSMVSRVRWATPPNEPREGDGRMKASSLAASVAMRVLSPRMLPPVRSLLGSTASTATLCPYSAMTKFPSASMRVLLPAPGTPVMPTRMESRPARRQCSTICSASSRSAGRELSTRVMAWASTARSPEQNAVYILREESALRRRSARAASCGGSGTTQAGADLQRAFAGVSNQDRPPTRLSLKERMICCAAVGMAVPGP